MKLANIILQTDKIGSSVPVKNVTPAELMLLVADNHQTVGGNPIKKLTHAKKREWGKVQDRDSANQLMWEPDPSKEDGKGEPVMVDGWKDTEEDAEVKRSNVDERNRLMAKYGRKKVKQLLGDNAFPTLPDDFDAAIAAGLQLSLTGDGFLIGQPE